MTKDDFTIISAKYADTAHNIINLRLRSTGGDILPYTFVIGDESNDELYLLLQEMYNNGDIDPEINQELDTMRKSSDIRSQRDKLLQATDKYVLEDYPISAEHKLEVKAYRQALRDITNHAEFPENVIWPTRPEFI